MQENYRLLLLNLSYVKKLSDLVKMPLQNFHYFQKLILKRDIVSSSAALMFTNYLQFQTLKNQAR